MSPPNGFCSGLPSSLSSGSSDPATSSTGAPSTVSGSTSSLARFSPPVFEDAFATGSGTLRTSALPVSESTHFLVVELKIFPSGHPPPAFCPSPLVGIFFAGNSP